MRFILVDEILDIQPGRSVPAAKIISPDEDHFPDLFPSFHGEAFTWPSRRGP